MFDTSTFSWVTLILKPFPGDPILDHPDFRDPLFKKRATEVSLLGGAACFLIGGPDRIIYIYISLSLTVVK